MAVMTLVNIKVTVHCMMLTVKAIMHNLAFCAFRSHSRPGDNYIFYSVIAVQFW